MKMRMLAAALMLTAACGGDDDGDKVDLKDAGNGKDATVTPRNDAAVLDASTMDSGRPVNDLDATQQADAVIANDATTTVDAYVADTSVFDASGDAGADASEPLPSIAGLWHDDRFGGTFAIDATNFGSVRYFALDESAHTLVAETVLMPPLPGELFNKIVWTPIMNGSFYVCLIAPGASTIEDARAVANTTDASDPDSGGCIGNPWSHFVPVIEIGGAWTDGTTVLRLDSDNFGPATVESYDNATKRGVISTRSLTDAGPVRAYGKFAWTKPDADNLYICVLVDGLPSEQAAADDNTPADASQLGSGCKGAAWTHLTRAPT